MVSHSSQVSLRLISCSKYRKFLASWHHSKKSNSLRTQDLLASNSLTSQGQRPCRRNTLESYANRVLSSCPVYLSWTLRIDIRQNRHCCIHISRVLELKPKKSNIYVIARKAWKESSLAPILEVVPPPCLVIWINPGPGRAWETLKFRVKVASLTPNDSIIKTHCKTTTTRAGVWAVKQMILTTSSVLASCLMVRSTKISGKVVSPIIQMLAHLLLHIRQGIRNLDSTLEWWIISWVLACSRPFTHNLPHQVKIMLMRSIFLLWINLFRAATAKTCPKIKIIDPAAKTTNLTQEVITNMVARLQSQAVEIMLLWRWTPKIKRMSLTTFPARPWREAWVLWTQTARATLLSGTRTMLNHQTCRRLVFTWVTLAATAHQRVPI